AIDALLEGMDRLFGPARAQGASAADAVRAMAPPTIPASWSSPAAQSLADRHQTLSRAGDVFAASDDDVKAKVDAAGAAVADGKTQMGAIKDDYKLNRDRLAPAASNPEVAHRMSELDRQRSSDGANTVRSTLGRLPQFGSGGAMPAMSQLGSMMPAAMAPMSMLAPALGAPLQALQSLQGLAAPATSMLSGLSIPQTVTHQGTPSSGTGGHGGGALPDDVNNYSGGARAIREAIDKALDYKGVTDPQQRADWAAGMMTVAGRESNYNPNAQNNWDVNAQNGVPSQGAFQFIKPTFDAYHEPGTPNDLRNPFSQACAFMNYTQARYGVSPDGHDLAAKVQQADPSRPPRGY
ncbi:transglycosylase SLT domain-containing protein, partial [Mycobacteroides abscessus]|uniref:transglycosylase SLT domain-containing protein n=1 Tax=Mycobacteroides abscessus TaxID=36809 RepID=UPI002103E4C5